MHDAEPSPAPQVPKELNRLVRLWKFAYVAAKRIERKVDSAKTKVVELLIKHGIDKVETKFGSIGFRTRDTVDWEGLARHVLTPNFVDSAMPLFTKTSAPFICAPNGWSSEAKQ